MMYLPEAVAEAILYVAEHPVRDLYIGSQSRVIKWFGDRFPRFTDRLMIKLFCADAIQERTGKPCASKQSLQTGHRFA